MKKYISKQIKKGFSCLQGPCKTLRFYLCPSEGSSVCLCACVCVWLRVCKCAANVCVCERIYSASNLLCQNLPQSSNYTVLTRSRWLRSDTSGGAPHDGGGQRKIYITAAHIYKCTTPLRLSVKYTYTYTHINMYHEHGSPSKDLFGSCVYPVCRFLPPTSNSSG